MTSKLRIGDCLVDFSAGTVDNGEGPDSVEPKILDVLQALVQSGGRMVSREALIDEVWGVSYGGDERLSRAVSILRKALGESAGEGRYIETAPKRGYRLTALVVEIPNDNPETLVTAKEANNGHARSSRPWFLTLAALVLMGTPVFFSLMNGSNKVTDAVNRQSTGMLGAGSENLQAYRIYQEARNHLNMRGRNVANAIIKFEEAIALDPDFASAYSGLATAHLVSAHYLRTPTDIAHSRAREMAQKALQLNPQLSEPDAVLAAIEGLQNNWGESLDYFDRAEEHDPRNTRVKLWYSEGLMNLGLVDASLEKITTAAALEPDSGVLNHVVANAHALKGNYDTAISGYDRAENLGYAKAGLIRGLVRLRQGDHDAAVKGFVHYTRHMGLIGENRADTLTLFLTNIISGKSEVTNNLDSFPTLASDEDLLAVLYIFAADSEKFLKTIEADTDQDKDGFWMVWSDFIPGLKEDPYFETFAKNTGLLKYWQDRGYPENCLAVDNGGVSCKAAMRDGG